MIVISDTSVLNYLLQIKGEDFLLPLFSKIIVPLAVHEEMKGSPAYNRFKELITDSSIVVKGISDTYVLNQLMQILGKGEAEAIVLAKETAADYLLIDERLGDGIAKAQGITTIGVLGILIEAKKFGHIKFVAPYLDQLSALTNFRISKLLHHSVLQLAGEI